LISNHPVKFFPMSMIQPPSGYGSTLVALIVSTIRFGSTICAAVRTSGGVNTAAACHAESSRSTVFQAGRSRPASYRSPP
jgi:hypothetical protein